MKGDEDEIRLVGGGSVCYFSRTNRKVTTLLLLGGRTGGRHLTPIRYFPPPWFSHTSLQQPHPPAQVRYGVTVSARKFSSIRSNLGVGGVWPARAGVWTAPEPEMLPAPKWMQVIRTVLRLSASTISTIPPDRH